MNTNMGANTELVIRDVVHGDIRLPDRYAKLVNTKEFQRLRRIKQLATADMVFPGAVHTRFSHSLGTYAIMEKMVSHFQNQFQDLGLEIDSMEWDALLAAALLHDIGHGPFSHVFEKISPHISHEQWGTRLIEDESTEIHQSLLSFYSQPEKQKLFLQKICGFLHIQHSSPSSSTKEDLANPLTHVFTSLVSSQLDADRMDYLLRDSYYSGFNFGKVDVDKLIEGLILSVGNDKQYHLCILQDYVSFVESYIISRFHMYKNIYYRPYKLFTEELLFSILKRAEYLCHEEPHQPLRRFTPEALLNLFDKSVSVPNYIKLDDSVVMGALQQWRECGADRVLSLLCDTFIERKHFLRYLDLDETHPSFLQYKNDLLNLLNTCLKGKFSSISLSDCPAILIAEKSYSLYNDSVYPINVQCYDGSIQNFSVVSSILSREAGKKHYTSTIYIDFSIMQAAYNLSKKERETLEQTISKLNATYEKRNHIEIEQKYGVKSKDSLIQLVDMLTKSSHGLLFNNYRLELSGIREQEDHYFDCPSDTGELLLQKNNITIRTRHYFKNDSYKLTIKLKVNNADAGSGQSNRFEFEYPCTNFDLDTENKAHIQQIFNNHIPEFLQQHSHLLDLLEPIVSIKNDRTRFSVFDKNSSSGFHCEISCDNLVYKDLRDEHATEQKDWQVEVELKGDYRYRVSLDQFCHHLKANAKKHNIVLIEEETAKYQKAMQKLRD